MIQRSDNYLDSHRSRARRRNELPRRSRGSHPFADLDQSPSTPAAAQKPDASPRARTRTCDHVDRARPTFEPKPRRLVIDADEVNAVVPRVVLHLGERRAYLAKCAQRSHVVTIGEHGAVSTPMFVQLSRDPHQESLHAARKCRAIRGLRDQMQMVRLNRVADQAKSEPIGTS